MTAASWSVRSFKLAWFGPFFATYSVALLLHGEPAMSLNRVTPLSRVYGLAGIVAATLHVLLLGAERAAVIIGLLPAAALLLPSRVIERLTGFAPRK
jgi:hypothetical protein